jgi:hypothetical protein
MPQQFALLKASAITQIQTDLENSVSNNAQLALAQAGIATVQAEIATVAALQAESAAIASGAPIVASLPSLPNAGFPPGSLVLLKSVDGLLLYQNVADVWTLQGNLLGTACLFRDTSAALASVPAAALQNGAFFIAGDVAGSSGVSVWRYNSSSSDTSNGVTVIAPISGVGRFILQSAVIRENLTVRVPTDFPTMGSAFIALSVIQCASDRRIIIQIQTGYTVTTQTTLNRNDFSRFEITSIDAEVPVNIGGDSTTGNVLYLAFGARSPRVSALFNMSGDTGTGNGIRVEDGANLVVSANCGVINAKNFGIRAFSASDIRARFSRFEGAALDGMWIEQSANADIEGANVSNAGRDGVLVNHATNATARLLVATNCGRRGVYSRHKSKITVWSADTRGSGEDDIHVEFGGEVDAQFALYETSNVIVNDVHPDGRVIDAQRPAFRASGTWTPTLSGSTVAGTQTYSTRDGQWVRNGTLVSITARVVLSAKDVAASGNVFVTGLPFAASVSSGRVASSGILEPFSRVDFAAVTSYLAGIGSPTLLSIGNFRVRLESSQTRIELRLLCADNSFPARPMTMAMLQDNFEFEIRAEYDAALNGIYFPSAIT